MIAKIHLMDFDSESGFTFSEWDGTLAQAAARIADARMIEVTLDDALGDVLSRIFALGNDSPVLGDEQAAIEYRSHRVRSVSVGDLVTLPDGRGTWACQRQGWVCCTERNLDGDDATRPVEHIELPADAPVTCACGDCEREHAAIVAEDRAQSIEWERAEGESRFDTEGA